MLGGLNCCVTAAFVHDPTRHAADPSTGLGRAGGTRRAKKECTTLKAIPSKRLDLVPPAGCYPQGAAQTQAVGRLRIHTSSIIICL
jgi:hypothetical protein